MKIYNSAEELIGGTPLVRLSNIEKKYGAVAKIIAKLEMFNPGGSAKDRVAKKMLDYAEWKGIINSDSVIIEPTSGNTGIGLALIGAVRGYRTIIVMPDSMSAERRTLMRAFGAELVLTDGKEGMAGAIKKAEELAKEIPNSFIPDQFSNPRNADAHFETTAQEIYDDTDGEIDIFVAGVGTGGTITGIGQYLKDMNPNVRVVAVEPADSPLLSEGRAGAHGLQGIGANFVPSLLDRSVYDDIFPVTTDDAYKAARLLAKTEGILVGITSGAALHAATELSRLPENAGKNIVVILPDTGDRYLSTPLFED